MEVEREGRFSSWRRFPTRFGDGIRMTPPADTATFHLAHREDGSALLEVEGSLEDIGVVRWAASLKGAFAEGTEQILLDLRGCRTIEPHCLDVLLAAAATMRTFGGHVTVACLPGSHLERVLRPYEWELTAYDSVDRARPLSERAPEPSPRF